MGSPLHETFVIVLGQYSKRITGFSEHDTDFHARVNVPQG
jgi:hypothetical protein